MSVEDPYSGLTAMDLSKEMDGVDLGYQKTGRQYQEGHSIDDVGRLVVPAGGAAATKDDLHVSIEVVVCDIVEEVEVHRLPLVEEPCAGSSGIGPC
jgi:hypothetical protein